MKCSWALASEQEEHYHDLEWGVPVHNDRLLFEFLVLESFQAGLSWRTILNKRAAFRVAFDNFQAESIAAFDASRVESLLANPGIIRNRQKIEATILNANAFLHIQQSHGSFDTYIWRFVDGTPRQNHWRCHAELPAFTDQSQAMSKALQQAGCKFVGKTICYAFMQAVGMVNDHTIDCFRHAELAKS